MKIRFDFVTNSSSTSFVIACKNELDEKELYELFIPSDDHPLVDLLKNIADTIFRKARKTTVEAVKEGPHGGECEKYMTGNYHWYEGRFEDEGFGSGMTESYLCGTNLNIETDDFVMVHYGGY